MQDEGLPQFLRELTSSYQSKRDYLLEGLEKSGFAACNVPEGSYFALVDVKKKTGMDDVTFCKWLVKEIGVCAIPNSAFYSHPVAGSDHFARFAFCKTDDMLNEGMKRLGKCKGKF